MNKHPTFDDRLEIERGLINGIEFAEIARRLGKNRTTISREVKRNRNYHPTKGNNCVHRAECSLPDDCQNECPSQKYTKCRTSCNGCHQGCDRFKEDVCRNVMRAPHVCNGCLRKRRCFLNRWFYDAKTAQKNLFILFILQPRLFERARPRSQLLLDETNGLAVKIAFFRQPAQLVFSIGQQFYGSLCLAVIFYIQIRFIHQIQPKPSAFL